MTETASSPAPKPPARGPLISADDALARLLAAVVPSGRTETVATPEAWGRVLARDVVSSVHVPPEDNSAMDGYAVRCADVSETGVKLPVSQRIPAGSVAGAAALWLFASSPPEQATALTFPQSS